MSPLVNRQKMILDFIKSCDEALAHEPSNAQIMRLRGLMYNVLGEYDKALSDFEQAIKSAPADAVTYYLKSDSHYRKDEFNKAKQDYMRALKLQQDAKFTEEDIIKATVTDSNDLKEIKTVIEFEKEQAILKFFEALGSN